jgi:uncharacterized protein (TIGR02001 family)
MKNLNAMVIGAAVAGALASGTAAAEITANVGATSNYLWRGTSLSADAAAVYGGVDYAHESGAYAGLWQSTEDVTGDVTGSETDVYFGYAGEAGEFTYDVGYISYIYLQSNTDVDYAEIYLTGGWKFVELFYANSNDVRVGSGKGSDYFSLTLSYDRYSFVYGDYSFDDSSANADYTHFDLSVALTDELSLTYSKNDITGDDNGRIVVAYTLEFDVK